MFVFCYTGTHIAMVTSPVHRVHIHTLGNRQSNIPGSVGIFANVLLLSAPPPTPRTQWFLFFSLLICKIKTASFFSPQMLEPIPQDSQGSSVLCQTWQNVCELSNNLRSDPVFPLCLVVPRSVAATLPLSLALVWGSQ